MLYKAYREHGGERISGNRARIIRHLSGIYLLEKAFLEENGEDLKRLLPSKYGQRLYQFGIYQILYGEIFNGRKTLFTSLKFNFSFKLIILFMLSYILSRNQIKDFVTIFLERKQFISE